MAKKETTSKPKSVRLKKEHAGARLYHLKKGGMNLSGLSQKELLELYNEKLYRYLFE